MLHPVTVSKRRNKLYLLLGRELQGPDSCIGFCQFVPVPRGGGFWDHVENVRDTYKGYLLMLLYREFKRKQVSWRGIIQQVYKAYATGTYEDTRENTLKKKFYKK